MYTFRWDIWAKYLHSRYLLLSFFQFTNCILFVTNVIHFFSSLLSVSFPILFFELLFFFDLSFDPFLLFSLFHFCRLFFFNLFVFFLFSFCFPENVFFSMSGSPDSGANVISDLIKLSDDRFDALDARSRMTLAAAQSTCSRGSSATNAMRRCA